MLVLVIMVLQSMNEHTSFENVLTFIKRNIENVIVSLTQRKKGIQNESDDIEPRKKVTYIRGNMMDFFEQKRTRSYTFYSVRIDSDARTD